MVATARRDIAVLGLPAASVEARIGDGEHLDLPNDSFDVVICGFGVFFFPTPVRALSECRRVLRNGGRFAASTFVGHGGGYPWAPEVLRQVRPVGPSRVPSPVATAQGLTETLTRVGFSDPLTTGIEARFVFADIDAYLAWNWSTGLRALLETLSAAEGDAYRRLSAERLEDHAVPDGYELIQAVELTVATKPASPR
jgi:SAM-dependent methyltransferase